MIIKKAATPAVDKRTPMRLITARVNKIVLAAASITAPLGTLMSR